MIQAAKDLRRESAIYGNPEKSKEVQVVPGHGEMPGGFAAMSTVMAAGLCTFRTRSMLAQPRQGNLTDGAQLGFARGD